jgi:hypothetical protein
VHTVLEGGLDTRSYFLCPCNCHSAASLRHTLPCEFGSCYKPALLSAPSSCPTPRWQQRQRKRKSMALTGKDLWLAAESHCTDRTVWARQLGPPRMERGRREDYEIYLAAARSRHDLEQSPSPAVRTVEGEFRRTGLP